MKSMNTPFSDGNGKLQYKQLEGRDPGFLVGEDAIFGAYR